MAKNLIYDIADRPKPGKLIVFAFQQLLAIIAATIAVPAIIGNGMSQSAALLGAGVGTLVYQLFTKFRSPVFLGSSFAFIGSMSAAFAGATSAGAGYLGLLLGAIFAGLVYTAIALVVKYAGTAWIDKLMPAAVIGPTVALIGLSLSGTAVDYVFSYGPTTTTGEFVMTGNAWVSLICALVTLVTVILCSTYGKKMTKLIPFIIGVLAGYAVAMIFTVIGYAAEVDALKIIDFTPFTNLVADGVGITTFVAIPEFAFVKVFDGFKAFATGRSVPQMFLSVSVLFAQVLQVLFLLLFSAFIPHSVKPSSSSALLLQFSAVWVTSGVLLSQVLSSV